MRRYVGLSDLLGVFLLTAVVWIGAQRLFGDSDPAMHVATGRHIAHSHEVPHTDPFSGTHAGKPWFAHEWLADVLWFATFQAAGWQGLLALSAVLISGAHVLLYQGLTARGNDPLIAFAAVLLTAGIASIHWLARPHLLTLVFVVVWATLLEDVARARAPLRRLALLPVLMALWVNLHGGFLVAFVVMGAYMMGWGIESLRGSRSRVVALAAAGIATAAATLVNPYGASLHAHLVGYFAAPRPALARNMEFAPADPADRAGAGLLCLVVIAAAALAAHLWVRRGRPREITSVSAGAAIAFTLTSAMAFVSVRHVAIASVFAALVVVDALAAIFPRKRTPTRQGGLVFLLGCLAVAFLSVRGLPARAGYDPTRFPVDVVRALRAEGAVPDGPVFAPDLWGGYLVLLWPEAKVFVDGRSDMYGDAFMLEYTQAYAATLGWQAVLAKGGVTLAILPRAAPLAAVLSDDPAWHVVASDAASSAFRRRP